MNRKIVLSLAALCALTACQSAGQLEQKPPTWTAMYQAPWKSMANCIVARSQTPLVTVTPTFSAGRAQIITKNPAGGVLGTFDVRQVPAPPPRWPIAASMAGPTRTPAAAPANIADRCARP